MIRQKGHISAEKASFGDFRHNLMTKFSFNLAEISLFWPKDGYFGINTFVWLWFLPKLFCIISRSYDSDGILKQEFFFAIPQAQTAIWQPCDKIVRGEKLKSLRRRGPDFSRLGHSEISFYTRDPKLKRHYG